MDDSDNRVINHPIFMYIREKCITYIDTTFPSPYSELLLGMTIGLDKLSDVPVFKNALKITGTIHVVVVSGFNISLVFNSIVSLLGSKYKRRNLLIAQVVTVLYAMLSGFEAPVVRALVMGSIISWGKYYGRVVDVIVSLISSALILISIQPLYFFNLSFILSFSATLGLILFSTPVTSLTKNIPFPLIEDFSTSLSAQILVWPIISYFFGTVSLISLLVNTLILWTVPFTTILGILFLLLSFISTTLGYLLSIPLYVLMSVFVEGVMLLGSLNIGYVNFSITFNQLLSYYVVTLLIYFFLIKRFNYDN